MAEVQDEEQWLYGDDKEDTTTVGKEKATAVPAVPDKSEKRSIVEKTKEVEKDAPATETPDTNGDVNDSGEQPPAEGQEESQDAEQNGDKSKDDDGDDSSSDDEPTVTIGKIVKQPDIMRPPPPTHRAAPTSGLKDDDFNSVGKVNGVPATDFNLAELEDKPWRKPGADLSDYFNYGFTEDTWLKYCERQKSMRTNESGVGLVGLGINIGKGMLGSSNIPVSIVNENSKYGGLRKPAGVPILKNPLEEEHMMSTNQPAAINTIQVMTADRRTYSNKVMSGVGPGGNYDDLDFGGNPYGADFFSTPPPTNFFNPPPPTEHWGGIPNVPPPGWAPDGMGGPPPIPHHHRRMGYFDEDSMGPIPGGVPRPMKDDREIEKMREARESRDGEPPRHHGSRRRSRSRSKSRHRKRSRSRSRSRSPSHRHKRKKSKRERETE